MDGEIKLMATGYCEKCKFKDLELASLNTFIDNGGYPEKIYEIHCKHEEICKEWNEKYKSLERAFNMQTSTFDKFFNEIGVLKCTDDESKSEEHFEKLHEYLDKNFGAATDGKLRKWG